MNGRDSTGLGLRLKGWSGSLLGCSHRTSQLPISASYMFMVSGQSLAWCFPCIKGYVKPVCSDGVGR